MPYFFNSNHTGYCQTNEVISKLSNLTSSYAAANGNNQERMMMLSSPIIMFILIALFSRGHLNVRAVLDPNTRFLLSSALALFLPVMSYLFSEAKDVAAGADGGRQWSTTTASDDLSVRARVILTWMLLVELLRKKVDEIRVRGSYSSTIQRAGRVVWLGSLVYFNIMSPGRKAVFSVLWILCATKLLQRVIFTEVEKRSCPDKSWLISSYMAQIMEEEEEEIDGQQQEFLKRCNYIVMGEEKLVREVTADGYKLNFDATHDSGVITVGTVWRLVETDGIFTQFDRNTSIRRVCLSFALFKLLRRRFEHLPPMTEKEARSCRNLMLNGSLGDDDATADGAVVGALFSVMADEVKFLNEYYHSVVPVVLASPMFVLVNYFLVPVAVLILCLIAVAVCGRGDLRHALSSMSADNYALQPGFTKLAICALARARHSRPAFVFTLDLLVTLTLLVIFFAEEIWEFLTVLTSNWFIISMLCSYVTKPRWRERAFSRGSFGCWILWLRRKMSKYTDIRLKQFSLLSNHSGPPLILTLVPGTLYLNVKSVPITNYLKLSVGECLAEHSGDKAPPLQLGLAMKRNGYDVDRLLWEYRSESTTEVILTWHIATCLLELEDGFHAARRKGMVVKQKADAAVSLSRYCAYLVVFHPELLPDRREKAELVLKEAKEELRNLLGFLGYYLSSPRARAQKLKEAGRAADPPDGVVHRGIRLALALQLCDYVDAVERVWTLLSDVWTEMLVYAAIPRSSDEEEHVKGHADILGEGVELITVLWAFAMHTNMKRRGRSTLSSLPRQTQTRPVDV